MKSFLVKFEAVNLTKKIFSQVWTSKLDYEINHLMNEFFT